MGLGIYDRMKERARVADLDTALAAKDSRIAELEEAVRVLSHSVNVLRPSYQAGRGIAEWVRIEEQAMLNVMSDPIASTALRTRKPKPKKGKVKK